MNLESYVKNNLLILYLYDFPLLLFASIFPFYFLSVILLLKFPTTKQNLIFFFFSSFTYFFLDELEHHSK